VSVMSPASPTRPDRRAETHRTFDKVAGRTDEQAEAAEFGQRMREPSWNPNLSALRLSISVNDCVLPTRMTDPEPVGLSQEGVADQIALGNRAADSLDAASRLQRQVESLGQKLNSQALALSPMLAEVRFLGILGLGIERGGRALIDDLRRDGPTGRERKRCGRGDPGAVALRSVRLGYNGRGDGSPRPLCWPQ
jgi:hypothetical protein